MSPFPSWSVIPKGWAAHHRPTAESTMTVPARFVRVNGPAPYPRPPEWEPNQELWAVDVRVQALVNVPQPAEAAEQTVIVRRYLVTAPVDGPAFRLGQKADQVHVLGRRLRIVDIYPGSLLWETDLICEEILTQGDPVPLDIPVPVIPEVPTHGDG